MRKLLKRIAKHTDVIEYMVMYLGFITMITAIAYNLFTH
jgi:hypothetical protein